MIGAFPLKLPIARHPHHRRGRRQHRDRDRGGTAHRRTAQRGRRAGPRLLRPRRDRAHRHRRAPGARAHPAGAARRRAAARRGGRARRHRDARRPAARPRRGGGRRRHRRDHRQLDGARHPHGVGRARPRSAPLRAGRLRRRGAAARLPPRRAARHPPRRRSRRGPACSRRGGCSTPTSARRSCARSGPPRARAAAGGPGTALEATWAELKAQAQAWLDGEQVPRDASASSAPPTSATSTRASS